MVAFVVEASDVPIMDIDDVAPHSRKRQDSNGIAASERHSQLSTPIKLSVY